MAQNSKVPQQFQFDHGNLNFPTAISISIWSRQRQFQFDSRLKLPRNTISGTTNNPNVTCAATVVSCRGQIEVVEVKLKLPYAWSNWSCRDEIEIAVNQIEISLAKLPWSIQVAMMTLKLPWSNWNCRGTFGSPCHPNREAQKIFLLLRKIFCERKPPCTCLDSDKMLLQEQNGQSRAGSIARSYLLG